MAREQHGWYTSEYKMEVVQKYLSDNYKVEPFSKEIGISKSTFYQWLKIYTQSTSNTDVLTSTSFQNITPVLKQDINTSSSNIKLTLPNGIALEFDRSILHQVIEEFKYVILIGLNNGILPSELDKNID